MRDRKHIEQDIQWAQMISTNAYFSYISHKEEWKRSLNRVADLTMELNKCPQQLELFPKEF